MVKTRKKHGLGYANINIQGYTVPNKTQCHSDHQCHEIKNRYFLVNKQHKGNCFFINNNKTTAGQFFINNDSNRAIYK